MAQAGAGEVCFVEDRPLAEEADRIEAVLLYHWNRAYPADVHLDLDLAPFDLEERREFTGSSHEKITREFYRRREALPEEAPQEEVPQIKEPAAEPEEGDLHG